MDSIIDENTAIGLLIFSVENSRDDDERVEYVKIFSNLKIKNDYIFKFLEGLVVSDLSEQVRASSLKAIVSHYKIEGTTLLKWVIRNEVSPTNLLIAIKTLNQIDEVQLRAVLTRGLEKFMSKEPSEIMREYCYDLRRLFRVNSFKEIPLEKLFRIYLNLKTILYLIQSYNIKSDEYKYGIEYDVKDGLVFSLKLWGLHIKRLSEIKQLKYLTRLEFLDISGNEIELMDGLDQFSELKSLKFGDILGHRGNRITEIRGLDNLLNLEYLHLSYNMIREIKGLENLKKLRYLSLAGNRIEEIKGLENLCDIETLRFENNLISGAKFNEILPNLQDLCLHNNQIRKIDVGNLLRLEFITLMSNPLLEIIGLENLTKLEEIMLNRDQFLRIRGLEGQKGFNIKFERYEKPMIPWGFKVEEAEKYRILIQQNKKK